MSLLDKFKKPFEKLSKGKSKVAKPEVDKKLQKLVQDDKKKKIKEKREEIKLKDATGQASGVIIRPLQTEKHTDLIVLNQYLFEIAIKANKAEVKKAFENLYKVKPVSVNIMNMRGKAVRFGRIWSKRKNWKKAIVTLRPGDKIQVFEGV